MKFFLPLILFPLSFQLLAVEPVKITVRDNENGWPVPLVELRTTHNVSFYSDNAGVVAIDLPELMGVDTWFSVEADGYERKPDGFGFRGVRISLEPGSEHEIKVDRTITAKRIGRLTGGGIFGESQKLGEHLDWKESGTLGSDSILVSIHKGKMFWAWGDTNLPKYPLGLYHTPGATTETKPLTTFEPPLAIAFDYFRDTEDKVRNVANLAPKEAGPTWISGYVSLKDHQGDEHLVGCYSKIKPPLESYRVGLCVWNDETANFESTRILWDKSTDNGKRPALLPQGHPAFWTDKAGKEWLLFGDPLPDIKMPPTFEAWQNPDTWEALEPVKTLKNPEGDTVKLHRGSIAWNSYRKKWITVFCEMEGKPSYLGEIWYAEADSPLGPWGTAVKVLSHHNYSFYNPRVHQDLTPEGSPVLLFEGTYTQMFSGSLAKTPRYDYNQVMYRLDLDDPDLAPARK